MASLHKVNCEQWTIIFLKKLSTHRLLILMQCTALEIHPQCQDLNKNITVRALCSMSRGGNVPLYFWTLWSVLLSPITYRQRSLQLASDCTEAVEHKVFTHAIDPLATGRQSAAHKVTAFPLTRAETPHDLHGESHKCIQTHTKHVC